MTDLIYRYRWLIIIFSMMTGVFSVIMIPGIKTDPDIRNYIPQSIPSRIATDSIEDKFGVQDLALIIFTDSSIITDNNLSQIRKIDKSISRISGVTDRVSPFTIKSIKSEEGMLVVEPLINHLPSDNNGSVDLKDEILSNSFANGIVFSSDLTTASITATISSIIPENTTLSKIDSVTDNYRGNIRILKGGLPYIRQSLLKDVDMDALILIPVALIIMLVILWLNLGDWRCVLLPFSVVVLATLFSIALIPLAGWKMSIIILLVPVILIGVANNYGIYLVARYQEIAAAAPELTNKEIISKLLRTLNRPVLFSGLTTIAGLLGLLLHSIMPAREVGILSALGISVALLMSLFMIPAMIFVCKSGTFVRKRSSTMVSEFEKTMEKLSGLIIKRNGPILVVSLVIVLIFAAGIAKVKISTNQENYFSARHPIREASEIINSKLGGSQNISVMIEGDIIDPEIMRGIDALTTETKRLKGVGNVFSISQLVREMSMAIYTKSEDGYNSIPDTREGIAQLFELYNMSGNPGDYKRLMDLEYRSAHILISLSDPENDVIRNVRSELIRMSSSLNGKVTIGGYALIMADLANSLIRGQISSLIFASVAVFLLLALIFRSLKGGLIGSIPLIASVIVLFGFMGFTGISIDAATALLSSIMIGVGVDFTIQYIWCFNLSRNSGISCDEATYFAMKTIGRSIIINALCVMAGFAALIFSGFTSIRFFGYLVMISIGSCLLGSLLVIPSILVRYKPDFGNRHKNSNHEK